MTWGMSLPPPSTAQREYVLELEAPRGASGRLVLSAMGARIVFEPMLRMPLRLSLGTLGLGLVDVAARMHGRFPVRGRLGATAGWLWTSRGGTALTVLGDPEDAPNAALLFTKPLGDVACFEPAAAQEIAARSPLGAPAIYGLLFRVADTGEAETVFRRFGLLRPLTDREVPPALRRSLPTDRPDDRGVPSSGEDVRAASSVAPPGLG
jgi:hypothetical protein